MHKEFIAYFPFLYALLWQRVKHPRQRWQRKPSKVELKRSEPHSVYLYPPIDFASIYILISCNYLWLCLALLSGHRQTCVCMLVHVCVCLLVPVCVCRISPDSKRISCHLIFAVNFILIGQLYLQIYKFICLAYSICC